MTTDMNLLADSYDAAADYIEQHGWYQGHYTKGITDDHSMTDIVKLIRESQAPVCTAGAGYAVGVRVSQWAETTGNPFSQINMELWCDTLTVETNTMWVADWNDEDGRTKEEVIDLLRMTALKIRAGNIGDNPREYEFEPMPTTEPVVEPAAPQPVKEPQPA